MTVLTYVDACLLISAATGRDDIHAQAMAILDDPARRFASSDFVKLEVLPKAVYEHKTDEADFYQAFFEDVSEWADDNDQIVENAYSIAKDHGIRAMDALHVSAARSTGASEIVSAEKLTKPLFRVRTPRTVSIRPV